MAGEVSRTRGQRARMLTGRTRDNGWWVFESDPTSAHRGDDGLWFDENEEEPAMHRRESIGREGQIRDIRTAGYQMLHNLVNEALMA